MDTNLAMILMTATFVLGMVYGSFAKAFTPLREQTTSVGSERQPATPSAWPIEAGFVALLSTYLPRYTRRPRPVFKRVPERIYWVGDEDNANWLLPAPQE